MIYAFSSFIPFLLHPAWAAFYYPDPQVHLLEHILVDNWGGYASNFSSAITPCTRYVTETGDAAINSGRTTAAQWMRVLFHDFITANVTAGTGGIDASIGFETGREENKGSAFNDSFTFWGGFVNSYVSMADLVALGTVMSNNLCGGKLMPFQPGRIDATGPDPTTGVPAPETSLEETLEFFERAGFNKVDGIGLTACGHTLGSVHHGGFPEVVDNSTVSPTNTNGGANFDSTRGVFDPLVVHEYLSWTGQKGGPLVTSFNESSRSDLRLYESDGNATMKALRAQGDGFLDTCIGLLRRTMNTVPSHVNLKNSIEAMKVKPVNVTFDFDHEEKLVLTGAIRILNAAESPSASTITLSITGEDLIIDADENTGTSVFGRSSGNYGKTTFYPFSISGDKVQNATSFSVQGKTFPIQGHVFVVPSKTTLSEKNLGVSVAVSSAMSCADLETAIAAPVTQQGTVAPKVVTNSLGLSEQIDKVGGYKICTGSMTLAQTPRGMVTVSVTKGGSSVDTLMVAGESAGW